MTVIKTAADRLRGHWTQDEFHRYEHEEQEVADVCLMGAMRYAAWGEDYFFDVIEVSDSMLSDRYPVQWETYYHSAKLIDEVIAEQYPDFEFEPGATVIDRCILWNDWCERSEDEVLAILEKAAAKEEEDV